MKRLRFFGHPVHPVTVHVPFGLLAAVPALDAAAALGVPWAPDAAWWTLAAGLCFGTIAATAGFLDYLTIPKDHPAGRVGDIHLVLMGSALSAYAVSLALRSASPGLAVGCGALGLLLLLSGAYAGGEMVYGHGIGLRDRSGGDPP